MTFVLLTHLWLSSLVGPHGRNVHSNRYSREMYSPRFRGAHSWLTFQSWDRPVSVSRTGQDPQCLDYNLAEEHVSWLKLSSGIRPMCPISRLTAPSEQLKWYTRSRRLACFIRSTQNLPVSLRRARSSGSAPPGPEALLRFRGLPSVVLLRSPANGFKWLLLAAFLRGLAAWLYTPMLPPSPLIGLRSRSRSWCGLRGDEKSVNAVLGREYGCVVLLT